MAILLTSHYTPETQILYIIHTIQNSLLIGLFFDYIGVGKYLQPYHGDKSPKNTRSWQWIFLETIGTH